MFKIPLFLLFAGSQALAIVNGNSIKTPKNSLEDVMLQYTVKLVFPEPGRSDQHSSCTGFLTANNQVTTAGHCVSSKETRESIQRGLAYALVFDKSSGAYRKIQIGRSRFKMVDFKSGLDSIDYALLSLRQSAPITASLPVTYDCDSDSKFWVAGFGLTENGNLSDELKYLVTSPIPGYAPVVMVNNTRSKIFLNNDSHSKVCPGDSGGPIFCKKNGILSVVGITNAIDQFQKNDISIASRKISEMKWCKGTDTAIGETLREPRKPLNKWKQELSNLNTHNPGGTD